MSRLTFEGDFCTIAMCQENPCPYNGSCSQKEVWSRLKAYEDTGIGLEKIRELQRKLTDSEIEKQALRNAANGYKEALERLKAYEDTGLEPQDLAEKLNDTYDLGYQSCLNHRGMKWTEAEELQRYRETGLTPEQVKSLRAQGEWEPQGMHPNGVVGNWCCSVCDGTSLEDSDYCPNCGAEMRGE